MMSPATQAPQAGRAGSPLAQGNLIEIANVTKSYFSGQVETQVLFGIDLQVPRGDFLAVMGLSLRAVVTGLRELGCPVTVDEDRIYEERNFLNWKSFES